jgi:tetratricopeptide (TPR) repeat protein
MGPYFLKYFRLFVFINIFMLGFAGVSYSAEREQDLFSKSMTLYKNEDFAGSFKLLAELARLNPNKALYWFNLGNCSYMTKQYEKAILYYRKAVSLNSPLAPAAKLYLAKALKQTGKNDQAFQTLTELLNSSPTPGISREAASDLKYLEAQQSVEETALAYYQNGQFAEAEEALKKSPASELSSSSQILLALALAKQSKFNDSERVLKNLFKDRSLSAEDRSTVSDLYKKIRRREYRGFPSWLNLDMSYGSTDNAYLDGKSATAISSTVMRGSLGAGYHWNQGPGWSQKMGYILGYENPQKASELQTLLHTLQAPIIYESPPYASSLTPYVQLQNWNNTSVSNKFGGTLKNTYINDTFDVGLDIDYSSQAAANSAFSYLSGTSYSLRPYISWWNAFFYGQFFWLAGNDGTQDITYSDSSRLPLTHTYQGPGLKVSWKNQTNSTLDLNLSALKRTYSQTALPGSKTRADNELATSIKYSYFLTPKFSVYGLVEFMTNTSTLGVGDVRDKNYDTMIANLGLNWEVF